MKNFFPSLCLVLTLFAACKQDELKEFEVDQPAPNTVSGESGIASFSSTNEQVMVQMLVNLAEPAAKAFQVQLSVDNDALEEGVGSGELSDTFIMEAGSYQLPNVVHVPYGALTASFDVQVNLSSVERRYGSKLALGIRLSEPTKGNLTDVENDVMDLMLDTEEVLDPDQIHYLSFSLGGGGILAVGSRQNYQITSGGVEIPLGVSLAGVPARSFEVHVEVNTDTIEALKRSGKIPANSRTLSAEDYALDSLVRFPGNTSMMPLALTVPWAVIESDLNAPIAVSIRLTRPTRHVLHPEDSYVVVLIDPKGLVETDITSEGRLSVSRDNGGGPDAGEGSNNLIDGDPGTKFLTGWVDNETWWMQLEFDEAQLAGAYTFTSANDAPERDPKTWELMGSDNGSDWVVLDRRENQAFESRFQERRFEFSSLIPYRYYRVNITEINGADGFQLAEWRLIKLP